MRFQHAKLSSSGVDLGGKMLFATHRLGFSGTPSALLPRELGTCEYVRFTYLDPQRSDRPMFLQV